MSEGTRISIRRNLRPVRKGIRGLRQQNRCDHAGAIGPVDLAFALLKSARVSTAGAIRARYHGTPRRVLFKVSSVTFHKMLAHCE